ncbi:zinc finger BED domain-containing protein RICESLEEPER 2-like [Hevea brasiliensis]|uniref:zinc finger BED domain-containing protein RICESLEEPER 2-like n=1 Tax=Hevea brasiliensis TaxID=3981 RepID=UPI0025DB7E63|nr:zinc finger BED domain-containing protein RICESLEEPER 2-like [Hevea brasiliensis]
MAVEICLVNWGIKRVFTIIVDNASSNDVAIAYLKKKLVGWGFSILNCKWNSTYLMLNAVQKFENAFYRYATIDPCFKLDLQSGSRYVTSNIFFNEISSVDCLLQEWQGSDNMELACMGDRMKVKFDKYWGDPDKMNKIIYISVVVDPRYKMEFMKFSLSTVYGKEKGMELAKKIKLVVYELFDEYKKIFQVENGSGSTVIRNTSENNKSEGTKKKSRLNMGDQFLKYKIEIGEANNESDLDCYLNEGIKVVDEKEEFDILKWWQLNSSRFSILSIMVRDILAVPISTVDSESTFSTGGRVLDPFRSSLTPKIVKALICAQDWLRKSHCCKSIEEQLADLERFEEVFALCEISSTNGNIVNLDG